MAKKTFKARGFANTTATTSYVTLFDKLKQSAGGSKKSSAWFQRTIKEYASEYKVEKGDIQENVLLKDPLVGYLYMFEYKAKMRYLPYYDKFPLAYVIKDTAEYFWAANLHYVEPKKRLKIVTDLAKNKISIPKKCVNKYLKDHVQSYYLKLSEKEWDTSIFIPVENFVNYRQVPYDSELVWKETNDDYYNMLKGSRKVEN